MNTHSIKLAQELTNAFFSKHIESHCTLEETAEMDKPATDTYFLKRKNSSMNPSDFEIDWNNFSAIRDKLNSQSHLVFTDPMIRDLIMLHQNVAQFVQSDGFVSDSVYVMF